MKNDIYLRRKQKVIVLQDKGCLPDTYVATALKNISTLGFTFSPALITALKELSIHAFVKWNKKLTNSVKKLVGANVHYHPMYPNFPQQVMEASEAELYLQAILHYVIGEVPATGADNRTMLADQINLKVIELGDEQEFRLMMRQLMEANTSISDTDKQDLAWAIEHEECVEKLLPRYIPYKEQACFVASELIKNKRADAGLIQRYIQTATDVLRLAVALSQGDLSLATSTVFRKFNRAERKILLQLLEQCSAITEDMLRYRERWIRLGEILHPAEYKHRFTLCNEAFDIIRNKKPFATFNNKIEIALQCFDTDYAVECLLERPGEFARRLDHLLRMEGSDSVWITSFFASVADQVATPVLLQVMTHFKHRHKQAELRLFFPKGSVAKAYSMPDNRLPIAAEACQAVVSSCEQILLERFSKQLNLGKVYIDEQLQQYIVPFSQRSASKSLRTLVRGSKLPMPAGDTIRFFLWWKEGKVRGKETGRTDIDLSATLYDENWAYMEHISYTNLKSDKYIAAHSGDIVTAPKGACEFIDLYIPSLLAFGGRYVVTTLHSYTGQVYCDLPECFAGWMVRQYPASGEVFEPATVVDRVDLASNTQISIPVVLDLQQRTVIWCDLALTRHPNYFNNIEGHQTGIVAMGKAMTTIEKPNLYELFRLHAMARGQLVERPEEAEVIFSPQAGITPFDIEKIISSFLAS